MNDLSDSEPKDYSITDLASVNAGIYAKLLHSNLQVQLRPLPFPIDTGPGYKSLLVWMDENTCGVAWAPLVESDRSGTGLAIFGDPGGSGLIGAITTGDEIGVDNSRGSKM